MILLVLNAGKVVVRAAVPPDRATMPRVTSSPLCGPLDSRSVKVTVPDASPGVTAAVKVTGLPKFTDAGDAVRITDGVITRLVAWVAVWLFASVTLTVKLDVPAAVGVPNSTPVAGPRVIPAVGCRC